MGRAATNLAGMTFGKLRVIRRRGADRQGSASWLCKCECGRRVIRRGYVLRGRISGRRGGISCGCALSAATDKTGKRYGRLRVLARAGVDTFRNILWECLCDCGKKAVVKSTTLIPGSRRSCGCLRRLTVIGRNLTHGLSSTKTYHSWISMRSRIGGKRGGHHFRYYAHVDMDPRWVRFENFLADMGKRPDGKTLDRINPNLGYWPKNCRWATMKEQAQNRRRAPCPNCGYDWNAAYKPTKEV